MLLLVTHCTSFSILCEIETANRRHLNNSPEAEMFPACTVLPAIPFFSRVPSSGFYLAVKQCVVAARFQQQEIGRGGRTIVPSARSEGRALACTQEKLACTGETSMIEAKLDVKKALLDPAGTFDQPDDIVRRRDVPRDVKLRLLEQWEREARSLAVAEEEGMTGGEESMLGRVRRAIAALGGDGDEPTGATTKHGAATTRGSATKRG